jgi:hypothetical protein
MEKSPLDNVAFRMATELLHIVADRLLRSEYRAVHEEFFRVCKQGLEELFERNDNMERMNPSSNQARTVPLKPTK